MIRRILYHQWSDGSVWLLFAFVVFAMALMVWEHNATRPISKDEVKAAIKAKQEKGSRL